MHDIKHGTSGANGVREEVTLVRGVVLYVMYILQPAQSTVPSSVCYPPGEHSLRKTILENYIK